MWNCQCLDKRVYLIMIFVVDDDEIMAECVARACGEVEVVTYADGLAVMRAIADGVMPELIFLDIMLTGPDGFTLLHEMVSYMDTASVPVVIVTSLDEIKGRNLSMYGVVGVLEKDTMRPAEIREYVRQYCKGGR